MPRGILGTSRPVRESTHEFYSIFYAAISGNHVLFYVLCLSLTVCEFRRGSPGFTPCPLKHAQVLQHILCRYWRQPRCCCVFLVLRCHSANLARHSWDFTPRLLKHARALQHILCSDQRHLCFFVCFISFSLTVYEFR